MTALDLSYIATAQKPMARLGNVLFLRVVKSTDKESAV